MDPEELKQWNEWSDEEKRDMCISLLDCLSSWRTEMEDLRKKKEYLEYTQEWILTAWGWDQEALDRFMADKIKEDK